MNNQTITTRAGLLRLAYNAVKAVFQMRHSGAMGVSSGYAYQIDDSFRNGLPRIQIGRWGKTEINYAEEVGDLSASSLVMAAVNWLGRVLPEAPLQVIETAADGKEKPIPDHPAARLMRRPNPYYSGSTLWKTFALSWIASGNPYYLKIRNAGGQLIQLWYVPPWMIAPRWPQDGFEFISHYEYIVDDRVIPIKPADVLHFRDGIDPYNLRVGLSPAASILREIFTDNEVAQYGALLMRNGGIPPVAIALKDGQVSIGFDPAKVKADYQRATQGDERGKAFVSDMAIELTKIAFSPEELDVKMLRRMPEERFAAVIGIPAIVLGFGSGGDSSTYNNTEQADERAIENYLVPLYRYVEEELTHQLGADFDFRENQAFRFDLTKVRALADDQDKLYERLDRAYNGGWLKRSEVRAAAGYDFKPEDEVYSTDLRTQSAIAIAGARSQPQTPPGQGSERQGDRESQKRLPFEYSIKRIVGIDYATTQVDLPADIADQIKVFAATIPDDHLHTKGREANLHVTIKYGLLASVTADDVRRVIENEAPVKLRFEKTEVFAADDFDVVYVAVRGDNLVRLNQKVIDNLPHVDTSAEYIPHATVAYVRPGKGALYEGHAFLFGQTATIGQVIFSSKDRDRVVIDLNGEQAG